MSGFQIDSSECKFTLQKELNEPTDPQLAIDELRRLIKGISKIKSNNDSIFVNHFMKQSKFISQW